MALLIMCKSILLRIFEQHLSDHFHEKHVISGINKNCPEVIIHLNGFMSSRGGIIERISIVPQIVKNELMGLAKILIIEVHVL